MKISVLGTGNGGCAVAFDSAQRGHDVALWDFEPFDTQIFFTLGVFGVFILRRRTNRVEGR